MATKREGWLDSLKGFAILLVILGHVLSGYQDAGTFPEAYSSFYYIRTWIYSFHMPLFFVISGFTFTLAYCREGVLRVKGFLRQMINLFWIYLLFCLLQWGVKQLVPDLVNETYTLDNLKQLFVEPLGNFWYIYVLFIYYGVGALLRLYRWNPLWGLFFGGVSIVCAQCHMDWTALTQYRILYHFVFFFLGSALCRYRSWLKNVKLLGLSAMFLSVCTLLYVHFWCRDWYGNWKLLIALATCYVLIFEFCSIPGLGTVQPLQICGRHCLELYLLHTFFTAGLRTLLPAVGLTTPWISVWVNFLISTGLSVLIAWGASKLWVMDILFRPARFAARLIAAHQNRK